MQRRLIGSETEWGIAIERDGGKYVDASLSLHETLSYFFLDHVLPFNALDPHFTSCLTNGSMFKNRTLFSFARICPVHDKDDELNKQQLSNASRLYYDSTGHLEYATSESDSILDMVAAEKAGEIILLSLIPLIKHRHECGAVSLLKHNMDFCGHSFAAHENYCTSRDVNIFRLKRFALPFLITRQILCGAGSVLTEDEIKTGVSKNELLEGYFSVSQRSCFIGVDYSADTANNNRAIINTRDETWANEKRYRRLHLILGDSNMSQYALALKYGSTHLVLRMLEETEEDTLFSSEICESVASIHDVSTMPMDYRLTFHNGLTMTPLEIQETYWEKAMKLFYGKDDETNLILDIWRYFNEGFKRYKEDPLALFGLSDWATKAYLLRQFIDEERLDLSKEEHRTNLRSLDQMYHDISYAPDSMGFNALAKAFNLEQLVSEDDILRFIFEPSRTTRAYLRHVASTCFEDKIREIDWNKIVFLDGRKVYLNNITSFDDGSVFLSFDKCSLDDFVYYVRWLNKQS